MKFFTIVKASSERVPRKNFCSINNGTYLWEWSVRRIAQLGYPVFINTDSPEVIKCCQFIPNVTGIKRSKRHIDWERASQVRASPVEDMLLDFCLEHSPTSVGIEPICLFHVTSPLLKMSTLLSAIGYLSKGYDSVQSVKLIQDFCFMIADDQSISPINYDASRVQRTQDLSPVACSLGAFFISTNKSIIQSGRRISGKIFNYPLDAIESIEVDTIADLELARLVIKGMKECDTSSEGTA